MITYTGRSSLTPHGAPCSVVLSVWASTWPTFQPAARAQSGLETSSPEQQVLDEPVEQIVVRGRKLRALREEVQQARERVYELFNAYNDDDLDIHCSEETRVGSRFQERVCKGRYVDRATGRAGAEVVRSIQALPGGLADPLAGAVLDNTPSIFQEEYKEIAYVNVKLREELQRLAREHPELAASIAQYRAKESQYRDAVRDGTARRRR